MTFDELTKFLKLIKNAAPQPELVALVTDLEEFMALEKEKLAGFKDSDEALRFTPHYLVAKLKLQHSLEKFCAFCNTTPAQVQEYIENPNNFTAEQWESIQNVKRETAAEFSPEKQIINKSKKRISASSRI